MLRPSGARMVSDPVDNHHRTCSHRPCSNRRSRAPQSQYCPYCSPYSSVRVEGLAGELSLHDRCANFGRGLDSALQSGKRPLALDVACTKYMVQRKICRSRERGTPHRRADVFGALLKIASGPWPVNVAFVLGCQASSPRSVPVYPGGMFPRWYHNHVAAIEKMFWAHNNMVYNSCL